MKKEYKIIENTDKARDKFGWNYGGEILEVTKEDLEQIINGKCLAAEVNGGEYTEFIVLATKTLF